MCHQDDASPSGDYKPPGRLRPPVSAAFGRLGRAVGRHRWPFLLLPLLLSGGLGAGFYFLGALETSDVERDFTPVDGAAKAEREEVRRLFRRGENFSTLRLDTEGAFAALIVTGPPDLLQPGAFQQLLDLDAQVRSIRTEDSRSNFSSLCERTHGACAPNAALQAFNYNASEVATKYVTFPTNDGVFLGQAIGGVTLGADGRQLDSAQAVRLFYFVRENESESAAWLDAVFLIFLKVSVSYFTSISREEEFKSSSKSVIPFFSITYFLAITISIISCLRMDCVRTKVWVAVFGVLSAGLAVLSSFGLLLLCGMPFSMTVATSPFLILGIGVDDMFIMISCWQKTKVKNEVEERMADTYKDAAVSITITTLTDVLAFYIGLLTPFRSVQSFCTYTGTALLFCYFYNITFFGAFLALNGKREEANRHWLTCSVVPSPEEVISSIHDAPREQSKCSSCNVGGAYDPDTGTEEEIPCNYFFKKVYGPFLMHNLTKAFVVLLYAGYLAASIYGCLQIKEGIDLKNLATDGSYVSSYYDNEDKYFSEYGPNVMLIITDKNFQYWNEIARHNLTSCINEFEKSEMVQSGAIISWLRAYVAYGNTASLNLTDERVFLQNLPPFLQVSGFSPDVNISGGTILASRMFIQTVNVSTALDEKNMLNFMRQTALSCHSELAVELMVYHPAFIYYDQYAVIVTNTIQNIVVATLTMLVISLLLIPNPLCSLWVTFAIASVIVGVAGFMAFWDVNLDSISMINLIICIGFSVDFSAHISYAFVSSQEKTANEKAIEALYRLGYPVMQGALSTIAGVVVLAAAPSYIFRTFFKIMFLVILFGAAHGIVFIPVFLTFFGACAKNHVEDEQEKQQNNLQMQPTVGQSTQPSTQVSALNSKEVNPYSN
uniref:Patched domain-containing protein 3 n=1 Tax=Denticeps clupeoides TaxID=299321 RepID=A0AAY4A3W1_9TELE